MQFNPTLKTAVMRCLQCGLTPMLVGEPGIGKSSFMRGVANDMHTALFVVTCNQLADRADITGAKTLPDNNGGYAQYFFPHATIMSCIRYAIDHPAETPILFMDEINRSSSDITSAVLSFTTDRIIGTTAFPENVRFAVAGNDSGNVTSLDKASISRFVVFHTEPDLTTFLNIHTDLNHYIRETLNRNPASLVGKSLAVMNAGQDDDGSDNGQLIQFLNGEAEEQDFTQIAVPRTIANLSKWLDLYSDAELMALATTGVLNEMIAAHTGNTLFTNALIDIIISQVSAPGAQTNVPSVRKPACYDRLCAVPTMSEMQTFAASMTPADISASLVYAMHEHTNRDTVIAVLSSQMGNANMERDDISAMMQLATGSMLDNDNVNTFLQTNTPIASKLQAMLEMCM